MAARHLAGTCSPSPIRNALFFLEESLQFSAGTPPALCPDASDGATGGPGVTRTDSASRMTRLGFESRPADERRLCDGDTSTRSDLLPFPPACDGGALRGAGVCGPPRSDGETARCHRRRGYDSRVQELRAIGGEHGHARRRATSSTTSAGMPAARTFALTPPTPTSSAATWSCRASTPRASTSSTPNPIRGVRRWSRSSMPRPSRGKPAMPRPTRSTAERMRYTSAPWVTRPAMDPAASSSWTTTPST